MRFQQFLNEAVLSTGKLEKNVNLMVASLERKVGQRFWRFGGHGHYEKFKRDDGSSGMGVSFVLDNKQGVLSNVLNMISEDKGNVLTINQGIPLQGVAVATISIETKNMNIDLEALLDKLRLVNGVRRLEVIGQV